MNELQENDTPIQSQKELIELISKSGMRCAYDLRHAAGMISGNKELSDLFHERAEFWLTVFNPTNGPKNYRSSLHDEIYKLELLVGRMGNLAIKHGATQEEVENVKFWRNLA